MIDVEPDKTQESLDNLKAGDKVVVHRTRYDDLYIAIIKHRTRTGQIVIPWGSTTMRFYPDGGQVGGRDRWRRPFRITPCTPKDEAKIRLTDLQNRVYTMASDISREATRKLTTRQATVLLDLMQKYGLTKEDKSHA